MDAEVLAALARWPGVPAVYGWLALTARGQWRLRGEAIGNRAIVAFIDGNYGADDAGCWFFQNGPQRVFVSLELTPWVWRLDTAGRLLSHTGLRPQALRAAALVGGRLLLATDLGAGVLDDRDLAAALPALVDRAGASLDERALADWLAGRTEAWLAPVAFAHDGPLLAIERLDAAHLPARFGFVREPAPPAPAV